MSSARLKAGKRMSEVCRGRDSAREPRHSVMSRQSVGSVKSRALSAGGQRSQRGVPSGAAGEKLFVVSLETLVMNSEWGSFNLVDPTSDQQMRVSMVKGPNDTRCLRVFKSQSVQEPSIELRPTQMGGSPGDPADGNLEICGPGGEILGSLNLQSTGSFVVTARGQPRLWRTLPAAIGPGPPHLLAGGQARGHGRLRRRPEHGGRLRRVPHLRGLGQHADRGHGDGGAAALFR
ncbi:unnamed protein product [Prorocentrum cordatum]|uniref:Altered inheritance of mitochondria protein 24, mitochondrial n=1 Tax=Prorocentrum cordatum TaxID=2364126 RepID=A0ABN9Q0W1_9DINO|nr:unnamed protein product [Polarella glacialis]